MHVPSASAEPIRLLALDLDGTLFASGATVSPRNQAALRSARNAGIEVVIATGRRHSYAMRQLRPLLEPASAALIPSGLLISSNGAVVRSLDHVLHHRSHLARAACEALFTHLGDLRDALVVTYDTLGPDGEDTPGALVVEELTNLHSNIGNWMEANAASIEHIHPIERSLERGEPIQMMLCGTVDRMRRAEALLQTLPGVCPAEGDVASPDPGTPQQIALHRTEYPDRDLSIVDILPAHTSKGSALRHLLTARGLTPANLMGIGDNWNDLPMLSLAGRPILMGNAPADLHVLAAARNWPTTASNDEDGVALAIEHLLSQQPSTPEPAALATSF